MTTAAPSTALATIQPAFTDAKRLALAGFLAGYRGLTREAYALDLRQFTTWCRTRSLALFAVRRADIETFARELEGRGPGPRHRHPPAVHHRRVQVRRRGRTPRSLPGRARPSALGGLRVPRHRAGPQRARRPAGRRRAGPAGLGPPAEHALISLLSLNGLRVSKATDADIEHLGLERGHRTLTITRKGGKVVTIPLAPRTARAIGLAIGERTGGPVFLAGDGRRLDRHGAGRIVRRTARRAGINKIVTPHTLRHAFITAVRTPGCRCVMCRRQPPRPPAHHDAIRPGPWQPGPARHLYSRRLRRWSRPVNGLASIPPGGRHRQEGQAQDRRAGGDHATRLLREREPPF